MGIDLDNLQSFIQHHTGARVSEIVRFKKLSGGAIQQNYALDVSIKDGDWEGDHHWVLRTDAPSGVSVSRKRWEEFQLLCLAFEKGITVPQPLWQCLDRNVSNRPFYIMQAVTGTANGKTLTQTDWSNSQRKTLVESLAQELALLHSIDLSSLDLTFLHYPHDTPAYSRVQQYRRYLDALPSTQPVIEWGLRWLELNAPQDETTCLCHCDFRTGNIMIDEGHITGILDWEFADCSSPLEDLGWYCARCWRFGMDEYEAGGIGEKEDFLRAYEKASDLSLDRHAIHYWQIMAEVRWAVIALQQTARHLSGEEHSLELALTGYMVPEMEMNLIRAIESINH